MGQQRWFLCGQGPWPWSLGLKRRGGSCEKRREMARWESWHQDMALPPESVTALAPSPQPDAALYGWSPRPVPAAGVIRL